MKRFAMSFFSVLFRPVVPEEASRGLAGFLGTERRPPNRRRQLHG